jgi:hypothetical protein
MANSVQWLLEVLLKFLQLNFLQSENDCQRLGGGEKKNEMVIKVYNVSQAWLCMPLIIALRKEDL